MVLDPRVKLKSFYNKCVDGMINGKISMETRYYVQSKLDQDMLSEYMRECGVDNPDDIDWNNPVVYVAHLLHDPLYRHYIIHGTKKQKQIVYDLMTPEQLDIYYNYVGDNGGRFCDLESRKGRKECKKRYKKTKKGLEIETENETIDD